ncbi:hypothetical protein BH23GEM11_BH23GEM11_01980 [soil metagenome]
MRISRAEYLRVGLDLGTSSIRAAAWGPDGTLLASAERAGPPLKRWRGLEVQDPAGILARAAEVLSALGPGPGAGEPPAARPRVGLPRVAFTTQRDTLLLVSSGKTGRAGPPVPLTPLLSWRERRHLEDSVIRRTLLDGSTDPFEPGHDARAIPLEAWIVEAWAGGIPIAGFEGARLHFAGGDKNCEYLALGVHPGEPAVGAVSLGSAISLGVAMGGSSAPEPLLGVVVTPMAGGPPGLQGWNVETGLLSGMGGRDQAAALAGVEPWQGVLPVEAGPISEGTGARFTFLPHFGGALDDPAAAPEFRTPDGSLLEPSAGRDAGMLTPASVARAWAEGVVCELARLRLRLEQVAGTQLEELRLGGGGATDPAWIPLLERGMKLPVTAVGDPFAGCRGAVIAAGWADPWLGPGAPAHIETSPPQAG